MPITAYAPQCTPCRARPPARVAPAPRQRRHAWAALAMMVWVVAQMILACHPTPAPLPRTVDGTDGGAAASALIAASLCLTSTTLPSNGEGNGTMPAAGCLHCTSGGCHGAARTPTAGAWLAFTALNLPALYRSQAGNDGAAPWQTGHPVRGPPRRRL